MRLVQVTIPAGRREAVLEVLDEEGIDYVVTDETSGREYTAVVYFPLPVAAVETVLERLQAAGLERDAYTVVIRAETVVSEKFEALTEGYEKDESEGRIARQELEAKAEDLAASLPTYLVMTVVSAVIATAGLLLDSPATVVGSMVIAPLIGPAMAAAVGSVIGDAELFRRGVLLQVIGVIISIAAATAFAILVQTTHLVPPGLDPLQFSEVEERLSPNFLSLVVAIGAGVAGALSLMTGISAALVGVMIAVALIPPAAAVGIGIAYATPSLALGAGVLVAVNVLSINLAALIVLWYAGYRPERFFHRNRARVATIKRAAVLVGAIVLLSLFLGGVTYDSYQTATTESEITNSIHEELNQTRYVGYEVIGVTVRTRSEYVLFQRAEEVVVTVAVPPDADREGLALALQRHINDEQGLSLDVQVRYVETERATRSTPAQDRALPPPRHPATAATTGLPVGQTAV